MLTQKQIEFCNNYLKTGKVVESARLAGYKVPTNAGSILLKKKDIQEYLDKMNAKIDKKNILTVQEIQEFLADVVIGKEKEKRIDADGNIIEYPSSLQTRLKASELLGRSQAMFIDKVENTGNITISVDVGDSDE